MIEDSFYQLVYDGLGVHVIEKLLTTFNEEDLRTIYNNILNNFTKLANNSNTISLVNYL